MIDKVILGNTLKKIRISKGITQKEVAQHTSISQSNYSKYEMGKIDISTTILISILDYFDISLQEFIFLCNEYGLSEKEKILHQFFNVPFHQKGELLKNKRSM